MTSEHGRPAIAAMIPTFNRADRLAGAIESALGQTYRPQRVVVVDDGSTDDTAAVVARYAGRGVEYAPNARNLGMVANWNRCVELAETTYVGLLHDDDRWDPGFLEATVDLLEARPDLGLVHARSGTLLPDGSTAPDSRLGLPDTTLVFEPRSALERLVVRQEISPAAAVFRRDAMLEIGGFRDDFPFETDWQAWLKVAARHPIGFIAEDLALTGQHEDRLTERIRTEPLAMAHQGMGMLRDTIPELPLPQDERERLLDLGLHCLAESQLVNARDMIERDRRRAMQEGFAAFKMERQIWRTSAMLLGGFLVSLVLPGFVLRATNRLRGPLRPLLRSSPNR